MPGKPHELRVQVHEVPDPDFDKHLNEILNSLANHFAKEIFNDARRAAGRTTESDQPPAYEVTAGAEVRFAEQDYIDELTRQRR